MNIKIYIFCCLISGFVIKAQITPRVIPAEPGSHVFKYDDAGNQIFRGYICDNCPSPGKSVEEPPKDTTVQNGDNGEAFWSEVQIYPVPVKNVLTINWTDKVDDLIAEVSLYEQNTVHWKFQQKNLPNLNKQVQIDMTYYYMGVYLLTFQLKDGRIISKNITKF